MRRFSAFALAMVCTGALTFDAQAQRRGSGNWDNLGCRQVSATDIQKYCASIERAKGAMRACLGQNQANLSAECNTARAERAAMRAK